MTSVHDVTVLCDSNGYTVLNMKNRPLGFFSLYFLVGMGKSKCTNLIIFQTKSESFICDPEIILARYPCMWLNQRDWSEQNSRVHLECHFNTIKGKTQSHHPPQVYLIVSDSLGAKLLCGARCLACDCHLGNPINKCVCHQNSRKTILFLIRWVGKWQLKAWGNVTL